MRQSTRWSPSTARAGSAVARSACAVCSTALASGREGEAYATVFLYLVVATLIAFGASMLAGLVVGVRRARGRGDSGLSVLVSGILQGLWYFLIAGAAATAVVTFLGVLWMGYGFVMVWWMDTNP